MNHIVYSTNAENTVTIDYHQTFQQFLTDRERVPFSAERLVQMLDFRARTCHVTLMGRLHISIGEAHCIITQQAVATLAEQYQRRQDWQEEYPYVKALFANACAEASCSHPERGLDVSMLPTAASR